MRLGTRVVCRKESPLMLRSMTVVALAVTALLALPAHAGAQAIGVERLGPQVGERVADFSLLDQSGTAWTLDSIMGPNGAMLVFSRSVDWCPYCKTQMVELQGRMEELEAQGLGLAVITYDSPEIMADFSQRRGITFPLLSDPGSQIIRTYGILNTTVAEDTPNFGIPFPGTFLLDRQGVVTSRFFEEAFQERNTVASILLELGSEGRVAAATRAVTDHLEVTSFTSDEVVAPGTLFSVVFDVTPRDGIHVYAPGANDYRIITLTLNDNPLLVTRPMQYPASEIYHFVPLDERVPVYQQPFRLTQQVAVSAAREHRPALLESVTIAGQLQYQACDDRICYNPRSVPISHTVTLRGLDTERANVAP